MKARILSTVFRRFQKKGGSADFEKFCADHKSWLDDFALFSCIVRKHAAGDLSAWPPALRDRSPDPLNRLIRDLQPEMESVKFCQYLFFRQWDALRAHARSRGVAFIGDLPIYVTLNSADVWTCPEIFDLDSESFSPAPYCGPAGSGALPAVAWHPAHAAFAAAGLGEGGEAQEAYGLVGLGPDLAGGR